MKKTLVVGGVLVAALIGAVAVRAAVTEHQDPIVIVQWANSHPMRAGLLPDIAEKFNSEDHMTESGRQIEVVVVQCDSKVQATDLEARIAGNGSVDEGCTAGDERAPAPTIITPQSADWLVELNHVAGRDVVDLTETQDIADTWLGIATYREMAECLGYPDKPIGYEDIIALKSNPDGWAALGCADVQWGRTPKLAFTNPSMSTSGRNVLASLYSIAAHKPPADLTLDDVAQPAVVDYVKQFQDLVDHYMPTTTALNTKIAQGQGYGHFFLIPEDNLANLYLGNETILGPDGSRQPITPVRDMVMIYPKEGSVLNDNPAGIVSASWVTDDAVDGAHEWIKYLRDDRQQERFAAAGFRPPAGVDLTVDADQFESWGLRAEPPDARIEPGDLQPDVLEHIVNSWGAVKNPAIVTFVVDVSTSMLGDPLAQVKDGLLRVVNEINRADNPGNPNQIGLVTFSSTVLTESSPRPVREARFDVADVISTMEAHGDTALYDAVARAITLTDAAPGDTRARRAVVVLSDGAATSGRCLDDIVSMESTHEAQISSFCGKEGDVATQADGTLVPVADVIGDELILPHDNKVQVFFLGFGDADYDIGRILAQATDAEFRGSTEQDLAGVIEELSGYF